MTDETQEQREAVWLARLQEADERAARMERFRDTAIDELGRVTQIALRTRDELSERMAEINRLHSAALAVDVIVTAYRAEVAQLEAQVMSLPTRLLPPTAVVMTPTEWNDMVETQQMDTEGAALLMREVLCERIYRERAAWNADHPNSSLRIREITPELLMPHMDRKILSMDKDGLKAEAARVLDLIEAAKKERR